MDKQYNKVKRSFFALIILTMVVILSGCSEKKSISIENFSEIEVGTPQDEIHKKFGDPSGMLFGFWGDIYKIDDTKAIIVYYDMNGQVKLITATDAGDSVKKLVE